MAPKVLVAAADDLLGTYRRYPGGAGWARIFSSVLHPMPNSRHTERFESFSTSTLRRMVVHSFMSVCTLLPSALSPSWPGSLGEGRSRFGDGQVLSFSTGILRPNALSFSTGVYELTGQGVGSRDPFIEPSGSVSTMPGEGRLAILRFRAHRSRSPTGPGDSAESDRTSPPLHQPLARTMADAVPGMAAKDPLEMVCGRDEVVEGLRFDDSQAPFGAGSCVRSTKRRGKHPSARR